MTNGAGSHATKPVPDRNGVGSKAGAAIAKLVAGLTAHGVRVGASDQGSYRRGTAPWALIIDAHPDGLLNGDATADHLAHWRRRNEVNTARVQRLLFDYSATTDGTGPWLRLAPVEPYGATRLLATSTPTPGWAWALTQLAAARTQLDAFACYLHTTPPRR